MAARTELMLFLPMTLPSVGIRTDVHTMIIANIGPREMGSRNVDGAICLLVSPARTRLQAPPPIRTSEGTTVPDLPSVLRVSFHPVQRAFIRLERTSLRTEILLPLSELTITCIG